MECEQVRPSLTRFLDNLLDARQAAAVEAHLAECSACWEELSGLREASLDLSALGDPAPLSADFTDRVMQRVHDERPTGLILVWPWLRQKWSRRQYASVAYAMSATLVVISASNVVFLWTESTSLLATWGVRLQAYLDAADAYLGLPASYLASFWQGLLSLLQAG